ncbi:NlpC/P60 family protein [Streptomyces sp. JJ36]|uniref:C40 family peptidase n=1 Tax=Streptomyces sp. JJ36 TaxID=2736645 RepID=UPI001F1F3F37|nr:C40 family peptidase [Streptomyces sp. JJ36]MCF6522974.1 C40 family peptidase [Streptomyces sp. JJ36]
MASHRSSRRPAPASGWTGRVTVLTAAASAAAALAAVPAGAEPDSGERGRVAARVDRLYTEAERATEKYNAAAERVERLQDRIGRVQDRAARGQAEVNRLRGALGAAAGAQYRSGGIDPGLLLMLSEDPDGYLAKAATLDRISARQTGRLKELRDARRSLEQYRTEAARRLGELERRRAELRKHKSTVQRKLDAARRLLERLTPRERAARDRASRGEQRDVVPAAAVSGRSAAAVAAVRRALGAPYGWGQAGPHSFDCSGLTQWAYAQAGVALPRTSQAQAGVGQRVPLSAARPGDLVFYRADASHVAMYVGNGQVVHAPYPGAAVRHDPVGMMPVSAVTRP